MRTLTILALTLLAVSACGRRGPLERPGEPGAALESQTAPPGVSPGTPLIAETLLDPQSPGSQVAAGATPAVAPKRRFLLDPLL